VKTGCDSLGILALEDVVDQIALNDIHLKQLDTAIADAMEGEGLERVFIAERCMVSDVFAMPELYNELFDWPHPDILDLYKAAGLMKREHLLYLDFMDDYIGILKLPPGRDQKRHKIIPTGHQRPSARYRHPQGRPFMARRQRRRPRHTARKVKSRAWSVECVGVGCHLSVFQRGAPVQSLAWNPVT